MLETNHQAETDPNKIDLAHQFVTVTEIGPAPRGWSLAAVLSGIKAIRILLFSCEKWRFNQFNHEQWIYNLVGG